MYYLMTIQNESTPALFVHETFESALAAFHTELAYRHESRTSTKCAIVDANLAIVRSEIYTNPVDTTPTEEPQEG